MTMTRFSEARITSCGNAGIEVKLGDPIGEPRSERKVVRIDRVKVDPSGWLCAVYDQDDACRLELLATWVMREGAFVGDSDRRFS